MEPSSLEGEEEALTIHEQHDQEADTTAKPYKEGHLWALVVPLLAYVTGASAFAYWLDAGEFVAAGIELGVAHPPGHPLAALVHHLFSLLPIGPVSWRIALASSFCGGIAAMFMFSAFDQSLESCGLEQRSWRTPLALGATWCTTGSVAFCLQAMRPEVYALHAMLACIVIERVLKFECTEDPDPRVLFTALLAEGFALANHHFLAILLLPILAPSIFRLSKLFAGIGVMTKLAISGLGIATYVYIPLRAMTEPPINLGEATSLSRFWWVISARVFQKNTGEGVPQPLWERFADVGVQLVENLHWIPLIMAFAGSYLLLRARRTRRMALVWITVFFPGIAARAWLGFVRSNPDALGYLLPTFVAGAGLALALLGLMIASLRKEKLISISTGTLGLILALLGLLHFNHSGRQISLDTFNATDSFDELRRRSLPARAVLFAFNPQLVFRHWGGESSEALRPDITLVPMPFLNYPGMLDRILKKEPQLQTLLKHYTSTGKLSDSELQNLTMRRPLFLEMDLRVDPELYNSVAPSGLLYEVLSGGSTKTDVRIAAKIQRQSYGLLQDALGEQMQDPETRKQLLWHHYMDALYYAGFGDPKSALLSTEMGLSIEPLAKELKELQRALKSSDRKGPLDVRPFFPN